MPVLVFRIALKSNYHLGAGYGKGFGVDSALFREDDRRPVIRGTTLCGLLRDGTRRLLELPPMEKYREEKEEILARLFGGPAEVKRWRIGSAYPLEEESGESQVVRRVRIDPATRRAEPQKLFSQEEGLAGEVFVFRVECPENTASALDEAALLVAAARNVRRLGRSRRRGLGECVIHLTGAEGIEAPQKPPEEDWETWFLRRFQESWLNGTPAAPAMARPAMPEVIAPAPAKWDPVRLRVIARLDEPVLVAGQSPAGNQYETRQYIPGTTLLGALAAMAVKRGRLEDAEGYRDFVSLFRREAVIFPTLYPARYYQDHLYPAIPAPCGLLTCSIKPFRGAQKEGHGIYPAFGLRGKTGKDCGKNCVGKMEPIGGFLVLYRDMRIYKPPRRMEMHIRIDEQSDRAKKGDLFGYTLLAAGQYFLGEMICADRDTWQKLKALCGLKEKKPVVLFLGKARQRGYGRATLWFEPQEGPPPWIQKPLDERVPDRPEVVSLTLLTETIITDAWGRQATGFDPEWLEKELGLGPVEIVEAYAQAGTVDGFNTTLGLPRWRDLALAAGSVVWLRFKDFPKDGQERMRELEAKGIGLRRNEGFGRIAFNHPLYEAWQELRDSAVWLPEEMRVSERTTSNDEDVWQEKLDEVFTPDFKLDERFLPLAWWIYLNGAKLPKELVERLKSFGSPEKDEGFKEFIGGEEEFGARDKEPFFKKRQQKEKVEEIIGLLNMLQEKIPPDHWQTVIQLLAERIGGMITQKKGE